MEPGHLYGDSQTPHLIYTGMFRSSFSSFGSFSSFSSFGSFSSLSPLIFPSMSFGIPSFHGIPTSSFHGIPTSSFRSIPSFHGFPPSFHYNLL